MNTVPDKKAINKLYTIDKVSPEAIGKLYGVSGRTVRSWMAQLGIPRLGPQHLRKGKPAVWNIGRVRSDETNNKNRLAHLGKTPHNKGSGRVEFTCAVCGNNVFDKPYRKKHTCSKTCKDVLMSRLRGSDHWNYKGDEAGFRQRERNWAVCRDWRTAVFTRDSYTCQKCGVISKNITAHHLDSYAAHKEARYCVDNGATLCWACHWQFHKLHGHKLSTKAQYQEWITMSQ